MTVLSSAQRTALLAKKAKLEARLDDAYDALEAALQTANKSYKLDTAEGMQAVVKRDYKEIFDLIDVLEAHIDHIDRRLNGKLNMNLNVRRKDGYRGRRRGYGW